MEQTMRALSHWLTKNNIPIEGVKIIIEFPEQRHAAAAEMCIRRDLEPMMLYRAPTFGKMETMNGIGLSLRSR